MAILDGRGRLFGRFNVFDAIVAILLLGLVPLAYGAYLVLRTPLPKLTSVEPATITYGSNMRFKVRGENLRPYLRVFLDRHQSKSFLFDDSTEAEVELLDVPPPPGVYDVVLYDQAQERDRLPKALTIAPSALPDAQMLVVGTFGNLNAAQAGKIAAGMTIAGVGVVTAVGRPVPQVMRVFVRPGTVEIPVANAQMVPAAMRMGCFVRTNSGQPECVGGGFSVQPTTLLFLDTPLGTLPFQIDQVRGLQPFEPVRVTVRFAATAEVLARIRSGDVDLGDVRNELSANGVVDGVGGGAAGTRDARLTVQAQRGVTSWTYNVAPLRLGSQFVLRTGAYEVSGTVIALSPEFEGGTKVPPLQK